MQESEGNGGEEEKKIPMPLYFVVVFPVLFVVLRYMVEMENGN